MICTKEQFDNIEVTKLLILNDVDEAIDRGREEINNLIINSLKEFGAESGSSVKYKDEEWVVNGISVSLHYDGGFWSFPEITIRKTYGAHYVNFTLEDFIKKCSILEEK